MTSIIIRGAQVVDGTGAPAVKADIAVDGDRISRIAPDINAPAEKVIEADGLVVAPGFIDIHAHGGAGILQSTTADSKVHDGITTEILGNCGSSPFPVRPEEKGRRSAAQLFEAVDEAGTSINRVFLVGLGSVRAFVMGPDSRPASPKDLEAMRQETARAVEEGAFGCSTGLIYPPGCFATREEIAEVAKAAGERNALYATHMRGEGDTLEQAVEEAEFISKMSGARLQISHLKCSGRRNWHKIDWLDERLHGMVDDGVDLACDRYTYTAASTDIGSILPNWVYDGTDEQRMERLRDPEVRGRVEKEILAEHPEPEYWESVVVSWVPEGEDASYNGKSLREIGEARGEQPVEVVMNLLARHKKKVAAVFFSMCEENLRRILSWPFVAIGTDARARVPRGKELASRPHPRAYGTFSRLLGKYVREEKLLSLEEAVRRATSLPARRLGLSGRGVLREGAFADITIFDPAAVSDRATFTEPHQTSAGIPHVLVNGRLVIEDGSHNHSLPGRMLRKQG